MKQSVHSLELGLDATRRLADGDLSRERVSARAARSHRLGD